MNANIELNGSLAIFIVMIDKMLNKPLPFWIQLLNFNAGLGFFVNLDGSILLQMYVVLDMGFEIFDV